MDSRTACFKFSFSGSLAHCQMTLTSSQLTLSVLYKSSTAVGAATGQRFRLPPQVYLSAVVHCTSLLSFAKRILFIGLHNSCLELPSRYLFLKENVDFIIGSVLELGKPIVAPDSTSSGERNPEKGGFALPVEGTGIDHVRVQDVENETVNLCMVSSVLLSCAATNGVHTAYNIREKAIVLFRSLVEDASPKIA